MSTRTLWMVVAAVLLLSGEWALAQPRDYASVAYWYQQPGGTDFFKPVPVEQRRPWGRVPKPPVVEAEEVFAPELARGARLLDDEALDYEFSKGKAIDLGVREPGDTLTFSGPDLIHEGPYTVFFLLPREVTNPAAFALLTGDTELGSTPTDYGTKDSVKVGIGVFGTGRPKLTLRFTSAGSAVFDCVQFAAARQLNDVVEAEQAPELTRNGPEPVQDIDVMWSGAKQLRFPAAKTGDSLELEATIPPGDWSVSVGQTRGPRYGDHDVFVNDKPAASLKGYEEKHLVHDWVKLTTLKGQNGKTKFRFVCTGKDDRANGYELGLDYLGWQRLVVEDAIEGETAELTDVKEGSITDQELGPRFSGGNHLWFHPSKVGASFTWLLDVPKDGKYELSVYFTKSWDYALVRLWLGDKDLGTFDTYAPTVEWGGQTRLGAFDLTQGQARLRFEVAGKSDQSKGILIGVDCVTLKPAP